MSADLTPYPKKVLHLPSTLSREEVNSLIESAPTPFQRTLLMALYATGLRRAEPARHVMLSPNLLEALREHWHSLRRKEVHPHTLRHYAAYRTMRELAREAILNKVDAEAFLIFRFIYIWRPLLLFSWRKVSTRASSCNCSGIPRPA